jgi:hypothetical protein
MRYLKTLAITTPMLLTEYDKKARFFDSNRFVEDSQALHDELQLVNPWTKHEQKKFLER